MEKTPDYVAGQARDPRNPAPREEKKVEAQKKEADKVAHEKTGDH